MRATLPALILTLLITSMMVLISCSSSNPVQQADFSNPKPDSSAPVWVSEWDSNGNPMGGEGLLGIFTIDIQTDPLDVSISPIRKSGFVDSIESLEITNYLTLTPCATCLKVSSIALDSDSNLVLGLGIRHPFPAGNPMEPPSGKNRADIHVFNVEGIIALTGGTLGSLTFPDSGTTITESLILNPSGFTGYLDPYLDTIYPTAASIHPYILFFDDYSVGNYLPAIAQTGFTDIVNPMGNLVMKQGSQFDYQDYVLDIEIGADYSFIFAIGCTYGVSTGNFTERFVPEYRVPQYNKKAASEVFVSVENNLMIEGVTASSATVVVEVLDMNHGVEVSAFINKMSADSSVTGIMVEIPEILNASIDDSNPVLVSGTNRDPLNPLRYEYPITNEKGAPRGTHLGLVSVLDSFPIGSNTVPTIAGYDGGHRVPPGHPAEEGLFTLDKFVTYQVFPIEVLPSMIFTSIGDMPNPRTYAGAAVVDDIIYVVGGNIGILATDLRSDRIDAFDPVLETWNTTLTAMPTPRAGAAVEAVGSLIYVIGGQLDTGLGYTDIMEVYDIVGDSWSTGNPLPGPKRHGMGSVERNGVIYIAGGYSISDGHSALFYRYDTVLDSWGALASMNAPRTQFAMAIKGEYIYAVGGQPVTGPGSDFTPYVEVYGITEMTWTGPTGNPSIKDFSTPPYDWLVGTAWENVNGDIILVGGAYNLTLLNGKAYIYNESTAMFSEAGTVILPRTLFASAVWEDTLYIFGGIALSSTDPPIGYMTPSVEKGN